MMAFQFGSSTRAFFYGSGFLKGDAGINPHPLLSAHLRGSECLLPPPPKNRGFSESEFARFHPLPHPPLRPAALPLCFYAPLPGPSLPPIVIHSSSTAKSLRLAEPSGGLSDPVGGLPGEYGRNPTYRVRPPSVHLPRPPASRLPSAFFYDCVVPP